MKIQHRNLKSPYCKRDLDNRDIANIMDGIKKTLNPFDDKNNDANLYCLTKGRAVSQSVKKEILHSKVIGSKFCEISKKNVSNNLKGLRKPSLAGNLKIVHQMLSK